MSSLFAVCCLVRLSHALSVLLLRYWRVNGGDCRAAGQQRAQQQRESSAAATPPRSSSDRQRPAPRQPIRSRIRRSFTVLISYRHTPTTVIAIALDRTFSLRDRQCNLSRITRAPQSRLRLVTESKGRSQWPRVSPSTLTSRFARLKLSIEAGTCCRQQSDASRTAAPLHSSGRPDRLDSTRLTIGGCVGRWRNHSSLNSPANNHLQQTCSFSHRSHCDVCDSAQPSCSSRSFHFAFAVIVNDPAAFSEPRFESRRSFHSL